MKIQPINFIKKHHEPLGWLIAGSCIGVIVDDSFKLVKDTFKKEERCE